MTSNSCGFINNLLLLSIYLLFTTIMLQVSPVLALISRRSHYITPLPTVCSNMRLFSAKVQRIERILANRGCGSRAEVAVLLRQGKVSVAGKVIRSSAEKFPTDVDIIVEGVSFSSPPPLVAVYKPLGMHCTLSEPLGRRCLQELFTQPQTSSLLDGYHPVGRLDADTTGLLLFSRDGDLTHKLLSPNYQLQRHYEAVVSGSVNKTALASLLGQGVQTALGEVTAQLTDALVLSQDTGEKLVSRLVQEQKHAQLRDNLSLLLLYRQQQFQREEQVQQSTSVSVVRLSVAEGKHRMVRRLLHNSGHSVLALHRIAYGSLSLQTENKFQNEDWMKEIVLKVEEDCWPVAASVRHSSFVLPVVSTDDKNNRNISNSLTDNDNIGYSVSLTEPFSLTEWTKYLLRLPANVNNKSSTRVSATVQFETAESIDSETFLDFNEDDCNDIVINHSKESKPKNQNIKQLIHQQKAAKANAESQVSRRAQIRTLRPGQTSKNFSDNNNINTNDRSELEVEGSMQRRLLRFFGNPVVSTAATASDSSQSSSANATTSTSDTSPSRMQMNRVLSQDIDEAK